MMRDKTVFVVCLLFALASRAGAECLLVDVETCQDLPASTCLSMDVGSGQNLPASKWLPADDDSSKILPAEALHLKVSPVNIIVGQTESLTVNCSLSLSDVSNVSGIVSLILSKSPAKENQEKKFIDLVFVNVFSPNQIKRQSQIDGSVVGQIDNDGVSFIGIEWSNPTDDHAGLYRCEVHGMDKLGYSTQMFQTTLIKSQQPNVEWLTEKMTQLQIQLESQNNLIHHQQVEIGKLSDLGKKQSNEIKTLSSKSNSQSDEINKLSALGNNQLDKIQNQADKINRLSNLAKNQSDEINKLLSLTESQTQIMTAQQSQIDNQSLTITATVEKTLKVQSLFIKTFTEFKISSDYNGHYYLLSKQVWKDSTVSAETCKNNGGYLAQIENNEENQFVKDFLNQQSGFDRVLISGTDSQHEGRWTYTGSDTDLVFYDWESGQPNDGPSGNCNYMNIGWQWRWGDLACITDGHTRYKFLCELETV